MFTIKEAYEHLPDQLVYYCKKATSKSLTRVELMIFIEPVMGDKLVIIIRKVRKSYERFCDEK